MGLTQPTLGRHIEDLETELGVDLFHRHSRGFRLTEDGAGLVESARAMADAADSFLRRATGQDTALEGAVRVSADDVMAVDVLPRAFAAFRKRYPGIHVELAVVAETTSLSQRDSDITVRLARPRHGDLAARHIRTLPLGLYAHRDWLARNGPIPPETPLTEVDLVGLDRKRLLIGGARLLGYELADHHFVFRCDTTVTHLRAVKAGLGVGALHVGIARRHPDLVRVFEWIQVPPLELWLACHRDVQHNRRIRALMDFLGEWLGADPYEGPSPNASPSQN